jgi:hypothetical protein
MFILSLIPLTLYFPKIDRLHGLVVRVPGYRSRGPGSISGTTILSEGPLSLVSIIEELLVKKK